MGLFDWLFGKKNIEIDENVFGFGSKTDNRTHLSSSELFKEQQLRKEKEELDLDNVKVVEEWYSEGKLKSETRWLGDTIIYKMEQNENGQVKSEIEWENNKIIYEKHYDENGRIIKISNDSISKEDLNEMMDNPNIEVKINTDDLPESPVKSIDDLDLDPETMEKLKSMTVQVGEDGVLPGIDMTDIQNQFEKDSSSNKEEDLKEDVEFMLKGIDFKDGEEYELETWKYDNGQIKEIGNSLNSQKVGLWRMYYNNGQLKVETFFNKDFNRDGIYKSYYENGQLKSEENYKDDTVISQKCWDEDGNEIECKE